MSYTVVLVDMSCVICDCYISSSDDILNNIGACNGCHLELLQRKYDNLPEVYTDTYDYIEALKGRIEELVQELAMKQ